MSRLIVKNLPSYVTSSRLREHFEQKGCPAGIVTDVKVALKPDGTSRRFGFIGYRTPADAQAAMEWFNKTFIDSTRISVQLSEGAKDAPTPRSNKRPRLGSSPHDDKSTSQPPKKNPAHLDEYLEVMETPKGPSWANEKQPENAKFLKSQSATAEEVQVHDDHDNISDQDWMRRHMSNNADVLFEQDNEETDQQEQPKDPTKTTILQTSRLFVRNLSYSCTETDLTELFRPFGELSQVHIPIDPATGTPKGFSYVTFVSAANAIAAYEALDKVSFQGRLLHILAAVDRKNNSEEEIGEKKRNVKEERNAKRKSMAVKEFNWSMLYMNSDAVASSIADRMNIPKSDILNPEASDNAAVKLALAETHIINETKAFFESEGVVLTSLGNKSRSETTILVKNIPYGTGADQIRELFEQHGTVNRVLVPPAGTMAVVDFEKPHEASKAFKAIAYRRLGNSIIYLEKGPVGMFSDKPFETKEMKSTSVVTVAETDYNGDNEDTSLSAGSTLFVKNLSFSTTTERLTQIFRNLPSFLFARIQTKSDPKRPAIASQPEGRLSMGYGFIGFKDIEGARKAMKSMQGFVLDGHALHLKFAGRGTAEDTDADRKGSLTKTTTKIIVKNVPFEATKKDIRDLFGSHGHLKSVRLPKKFDSRTRGFAFLEFVSHQEAKNAFKSLRHTHLLGRHLVLEWADEAGQDLETLRKKAAAGFSTGVEMPGRKRKLDMDKRNEDE